MMAGSFTSARAVEDMADRAMSNTIRVPIFIVRLFHLVMKKIGISAAE
jgi:hypothetical protein